MLFEIYSSIAYFISRNLLKLGLILFFRFKVKGGQNIPSKGTFIIASNHVSYIDPPIVGSASKRRVYFITGDHLYKNKLLGWWYKAVACLRIKRKEPDHRAMRRILNYLKNDKPIAIFPEGARSSDGRMREPLAGIGFLAFKSQAPVVPCFVKGSQKALPKGAKFFKPSNITVYIGEPIYASNFRYDNKKEAYRLFSKKVMDSIIQLGERYGD